MQKIVGDRLRPATQGDPYGVAEARALLQTSLDMVEQEMAGKRWALGDAFTMADCAAAPALFYATKVMPLGPSHKTVAAYLDRLRERPSFAARVRGSRALLRDVPPMQPPRCTLARRIDARIRGLPI